MILMIMFLFVFLHQLLVMQSFPQAFLFSYASKCLYWAIQAGLLTPLTFAQHRLSPLAAFTSGAYSLQWKAVTVNLRILHCQL